MENADALGPEHSVLGNHRQHRRRAYRGCHHPPLALLAGAQALPAVQEDAAQMGLLGLERWLDLRPLRLRDRRLGAKG